MCDKTLPVGTTFVRVRKFLALLLVAYSLFVPQRILAQNKDDGQTTRIVFLGTGTPIADPDRSGPSVAIVVKDTPYLVDLGPGVVRRASAARLAGVKGLAPPNLKRAFVTHLHSDHTVGYPDLIFTPWVLGRNEPLKVYGPKGIRAMTEHILAAYQQDIDVRLHGLEQANPQGYQVDVHEVEPGVVYEDSNVTVEAFLVNHGSWSQAFGYKFRTSDRTIVISGDTAPSERVVEMCNGCDVLIHEVYSEAGLERQSRYHSNFHTSAGELAKIAATAKPGLLILYHQLFRGSTEGELLAEIQKGYSGKIASAKDLEIY